MEVTRPVVKRSGRGGSVEADSGKFYTFNYVVQRIVQSPMPPTYIRAL